MSGLFEYYIETENFHFKYAKGEPELKGEEFHDYDEFVLFLDGESRLISKNIQLDLTPGSIVMIPKGQFHQFIIPYPKTYKRCILGFRETPELSELIREVMSDVKIITSPDKNILSVFENLINIVESTLPDEEKKLFVKASLVQLLVFYKQHPHNVISRNINISSEVRQALSYIDKNFTKELSIEIISAALHISTSTLAHKFSKELNISVYRYISEKRLLKARQHIEKGATLASAAAACGFGDYSCFFRMYKKRYGKTPSGGK